LFYVTVSKLIDMIFRNIDQYHPAELLYIVQVCDATGDAMDSIVWFIKKH